MRRGQADLAGDHLAGALVQAIPHRESQIGAALDQPWLVGCGFDRKPHDAVEGGVARLAQVHGERKLGPGVGL